MLRLKLLILSLLPKLPVRFNYFLSGFNSNPKYVFGKEYSAYIDALKDNNSYLYKTEERLLSIVNYAIENVPYYKNLYKNKINSMGEFKTNVAFISKEILMDNHSDFISDTIDKSKFDIVTTAGTTGKPLSIYVPKSRYSSELATLHSTWSRVGYNFDLRGVIRNHKLPKYKKYIINPITKELIFDNFRMDDQYLKVIYDSLRKYKVKYLHAYPSAAYQFTKFAYNNNLDLSFIKAIFCSSENVEDYQRIFIEDKCNIKVMSFYGHSEKLVLGAYCEKSPQYHMDSTYGFFELVDNNGHEIKQQGMIGEIVGTTLNNYGMPLIRYQTGDYAEYKSNYCSICERNQIVLKTIKGRWNGDRIYRADGTYVTTTALNLHNDLFEVINGLQYVQSEKGKLQVCVIQGKGFSDLYDRKILQHFVSKLGDAMNIEIKYVDSLIFQANGKFLQLISDVK